MESISIINIAQMECIKQGWSRTAKSCATTEGAGEVWQKVTKKANANAGTVTVLSLRLATHLGDPSVHDRDAEKQLEAW